MKREPGDWRPNNRFIMEGKSVVAQAETRECASQIARYQRIARRVPALVDALDKMVPKMPYSLAVRVCLMDLRRLLEGKP